MRKILFIVFVILMLAILADKCMYYAAQGDQPTEFPDHSKLQPVSDSI